jgi:hypothetical protein
MNYDNGDHRCEPTTSKTLCNMGYGNWDEDMERCLCNIDGAIRMYGNAMACSMVCGPGELWYEDSAECRLPEECKEH